LRTGRHLAPFRGAGWCRRHVRQAGKSENRNHTLHLDRSSRIILPSRDTTQYVPRARHSPRRLRSPRAYRAQAAWERSTAPETPASIASSRSKCMLWRPMPVPDERRPRQGGHVADHHRPKLDSGDSRSKGQRSKVARAELRECRIEGQKTNRADAGAIDGDLLRASLENLSDVSLVSTESIAHSPKLFGWLGPITRHILVK
jgi:hypothetical protein